MESSRYRKKLTGHIGGLGAGEGGDWVDTEPRLGFQLVNSNIIDL